MTTEFSPDEAKVTVSRAEFEALKDAVAALRATPVEAIKVVPVEVIKVDPEAKRLAAQSQARLDRRRPLIGLGLAGFAMTVVMVCGLGASAFTVHTKNEDSEYTYTISGQAGIAALTGLLTFIASIGLDQEEKRLGLFHRVGKLLKLTEN